MPQFSAEVGITAKVGIIIRPVAVIFTDAVPCGEEQISDAIARMSSENLKSGHILIRLDGSSCQIETDDSVTLVFFPMNPGEILNQRSLHFTLK